MSLPLRKDDKFEIERILEERFKKRREDLNFETPWIEQLQKESKTKGFVNFE